MYDVCTVKRVPTTIKDARWNLRVTPDADSLVRWAASLSSTNLTEFVMQAAVGEAERLLADRNRFVLDDERWKQFVVMLDRPARDNPGLAKLFSGPDVFE